MRLAEDEGKQETPEPLDGLFQADLPVSFSLLLAVLGRLLHPALPGLVPAIVADGMAQGQQGIDVLAFRAPSALVPASYSRSSFCVNSA